MLLSQPSFHFYTLPFSSFLTTLSTLCHSSLPLFLHFLFFPILFIISLSPLLIFTLISFHHITLHIIILTVSSLSLYSSIHSNHIPCLLSSSHLHHAHHLAYSSIIHPTSSSFHPPSIPLFSHFSLFHSSISPWCSSRFPQNSFSLISFIIPNYSLFHPPFLSISPPSPSSPLIPVIHFYSHPCSLSIHFHAFPSHSSSYPFQSHSLLSISIPIIPFPFIFPIHSQFLYDLSLSLHQWYSTLHSASLTLISSILSLPSYTYHSSLFFAAHLRFPTTRSIPCLFG